MKIIKQHGIWVTAIIEDRWVQAKVYDVGSIFGIDNGRVSKLAISKTANRNPNKPFHEQLAYHYDRGEDINDIDQALLDRIVAELEALPKLYGQGQ